MNILQVLNLSKSFGRFHAVKNVSFDLREGEILGLLGKNGAGKTTIIQMLLGVLEPTRGDICYFGKNFFKNREFVLENINFSSTYTNLPWDLSVKDNLHYFSYFYNISERRKRVQYLVKLFQLGKLYRQKVRELSAGEITKVNLAKAMLNFPKVLLLDEPTASLDPDIALSIRELLLEQQKKFKTSIILTSHNMAEVEAICDRVIFIDKGRLIADNTPKDLARKVKISHLSLTLDKGKTIIMNYCKQKRIPFSFRNNEIVLDVSENKISSHLHMLMKLGVRYSEISIQKPTLEDYFLHTISKKP